jgi:HEAT repeat protein
MALVRVVDRPPTPPLPSTAPAASLTALLAALQAPETGSRRAAARDLGHHPEAIPTLCDRLGCEPALSVRCVILTTLVGLQSPATVAGLLPYLRSEDAGVRNAVIEALQEMPAAVAPFMQDLLDDADSDVRILAVQILSALPHAEAPHWLVHVLVADPHVNVCAAAVDCLAEVGDLAAIPALQALPPRFPDEPFIAFAVATAIRRIDGR